MVSFVGTPFSQAVSAFTDEQIASLARTYGGVSHPVWVTDFQDRCVYRNTPATRNKHLTNGALSFDILDHKGRVIGRLKTIVR